MVTGNIVEGAVSGPGIVLNPNPAAGSTRKLTALASGNTVKGCQFGIGFVKDYPSCYCMITGNMVEGSSGGAIVPISLPQPYYNWNLVSGASDYGTINGGIFTGRPFSNVAIGLNFAV